MRVPAHRLVVDEEGAAESVSRPANDFPGLVRLQIHKHTLSQKHGGYTAAENNKDIRFTSLPPSLPLHC